MDAHNIGTRLLYRDALMLVIDKPAGLAVHGGPRGGGHSLVDELDALRFGLPRRPEAAHRLDSETSGCLVLGRHRQALARLGRLFETGRVGKTYWAVVEGGPAAESGEIDLPLARRSSDPADWTMRIETGGLPSLTRWRVLGRGDGIASLELEPLTGRTHQLRVHYAAQGWPILGDRIYGDGHGSAERLHLHATRITVPLYPKKPAIVVKAPLPERMQSGLASCGLLERPTS